MVGTSNIRQNFETELIYSDEELIVAAQCNTRAFIKLYQRYYQEVFIFIQNRINNKLTTTILVKQVFLTALKGVKRHNSQKAFYSTYLLKIALKECNSCLKKDIKLGDSGLLQYHLRYLVNQLSIVDDSPYCRGELNNALRLLSVNEIQMVELRDFDKRSFREMANILQVSETIARLKYYMVVNKLNGLLPGRKGDWTRSFHNKKVLPMKNAISIEEIESTMDFEVILKALEYTEVTIAQILREAIIYIEGQVLRRALVGIGIIALLGVTMNFFIPDKNPIIQNQTTPADLQKDLNTKKSLQTEVTYQEDIACLAL